MLLVKKVRLGHMIIFRDIFELKTDESSSIHSEDNLEQIYKLKNKTKPPTKQNTKNPQTINYHHPQVFGARQ